MSDSLAGAFKETAREFYERVKRVSGDVIREAGEAIADEAEREGLTPEKLGRKLRRAATHVSDTVAGLVQDARGSAD